MKASNRCLWMVLAWFLCSFCGVFSVWGAEYTVTPVIQGRTGYDDSVQFKGAGDVEYLIQPKVGVKAKTEASVLEASAGVDIYEYRRLDEFDRVNQRFDLSASTRINPTWELGFSGDYKYDHTFDDALEESGVLADQSKRKRTNLAPEVSFVLDPRNTFKGTYRFSDAFYEKTTYSDYHVHGVTLDWYHALQNERSQVVFSLGGSDATYELSSGDSEQQTYRGLIGLIHQFSESLSLTIMGGGHYVESEYPRVQAGVTSTVEDDDTGFLVDGSLDWKGERCTLSANVNRDIAQGLYGENVARDQVTLEGTYAWSERMRLKLRGTYRHSESDGFIRSQEEQSYGIHPTLSYRVMQGITVSAGYAYTWFENQITDNEKERNRVFATVSFRWPYLLDG